MSSKFIENKACNKNWQNFTPARFYRKILGSKSNNFMKCLCKIIIRQIEAWMHINGPSIKDVTSKGIEGVPKNGDLEA